jgi:hypothetical protein
VISADPVAHRIGKLDTATGRVRSVVTSAVFVAC